VDYWHGIGAQYQGRAWGAHQIQTGGSAMLLAGCHGVDAVRWFSGDEVEEVVAYGNNPKGLYEYPANVTAIFKFRGGAMGKTSVLLDAEMPYTFNIDLVGTEGTLRDNRIWAKKLFPGQTGWNAMETILPTSADVHHHPFDAQVNHFVECLRTNRESPCNIADGYRTHELCLAIDRSVEQGGKPVRLPLD
jgi:predicted dehydrogenase